MAPRRPARRNPEPDLLPDSLPGKREPDVLPDSLGGTPPESNMPDALPPRQREVDEP